MLLLRKPTGLCQPTVWVDGLPLGEARQSLDQMIDSQIIEGVELYPSVSTAPLRFRSGDCGIVLFWTRQVPEEASPRPKRWKVALVASAVLGLLVVTLASLK